MRGQTEQRSAGRCAPEGWTAAFKTSKSLDSWTPLWAHFFTEGKKLLISLSQLVPNSDKFTRNLIFHGRLELVTIIILILRYKDSVLKN